jgi:hypothetical protein
MAASITSGPSFLQNTGPIGPTIRTTLTTITPDTSYPTGGYALTAAQLGLSNVADAVCNIVGGTTNNGAVAASYNAATGKLQLWATGGTSPVTLAEVASTTNVSGVTVKVAAFGY